MENEAMITLFPSGPFLIIWTHPKRTIPEGFDRRSLPQDDDALRVPPFRGAEAGRSRRIIAAFYPLEKADVSRNLHAFPPLQENDFDVASATLIIPHYGYIRVMKRQIIRIDEDKCTGCGLCAGACHKGRSG
jgi:ferredoxin